MRDSQACELTTEKEIALLIDRVGGLPSSYLNFLRSATWQCGMLQTSEAGDTAALHPDYGRTDGLVARLFSAGVSLKRNDDYAVQQSLPQLWMIGDDGGDYGYCFLRTDSPSDSWPVIEVALGAIFEDELEPVADSFSAWRERSFVIGHRVITLPPPSTQ